MGRAITKYTRREDVVLATKVMLKMHDGDSPDRGAAKPRGQPTIP
ncbi:hypothetical protein SAMN04487914_12211 [Arthrobacter sp. ok909]|nr:hypothetical protein [Arthrobacter sp. ok909]SDP63362.1 hypothetical protein SAMN04487914_12211 [Arthrobacter sp. ok909]